MVLILALLVIFTVAFVVYYRSEMRARTQPDPDDIAYVTDYAHKLVRGAFEDRQSCIETIAEMIDEDGLSGVLDAETLVDREIADLEAEAADWPEETDNTRLETAFAALEARGIVARQDFTCCGTCGAAEINDEFSALPGARGYTFFHTQSTEHAIDGLGIALSYGAAGAEASDADHVEVGREVAEALRAAGLRVDWSGALSMCIMVEMTWRRRWDQGARFTQGWA